MKTTYISHFKTMADSTPEDVKHIIQAFNHYLEPEYLTNLNKNAREKFCQNAYYRDAIEFVEKYDDKAFDVDYNNMTLEDFKPMMVEFFNNRNADHTMSA